MKEVSVPEPVNLPAQSAVQENLQSDVLKVDGQPGFFFQTKLNVGAPDDPLEKEADEVADHVMRMPESNFLQRKCNECEAEEKKEESIHKKPLSDTVTTFIQRKSIGNPTSASDQVSQNIHNSRGNGSSLDDTTQTFMSSRFGSDFSNVNIHTDSNAVQLSRELNAKAFTVGNDIYFNQSQYQPQSSEGKQLLAHELTHTIQQGGNHINMKSESLTPDREHSFLQRKHELNSQVNYEAVSTPVPEIKPEVLQKNSIGIQKQSFAPPPDDPNTGLNDLSIQRKCAHCEAEEEIQRKPGDLGESYLQSTGNEADVIVYTLLGAYDEIQGIGSLHHVLIISGTTAVLYSIKGDVTGFEKTIQATYTFRSIAFGNHYLIQTVGNKFALLGMVEVEQADGDKILKYALMGWKGETPEDKKAADLDDKELQLDTWFSIDAERKDFHSKAEGIGFAVAFIPAGSFSTTDKRDKDKKEGPVLSTNYPDWFKDLKKRIEAKIAEDRAANKDNPNLPDRIFFYGSDKVQITKGADAWTIEVEKGKSESYLTVLKSEWDAANDKDIYTVEVVQKLYTKVKLMIDEADIKKDEQKEITDIDSTPQTKGNKFAWAIKLRQQIEEILSKQRKSEKEATDFPDKLSISIQKEAETENVYLRVWIYKIKKEASITELPELIGGTIPIALKETDKAADWAPMVRKAAGAIRSGNITTDNMDVKVGDKDQKGDPTILPPYPANIFPRNLSADRNTATVASNNFRMVLDTASVHGNNLLNLTLLHMAMNNFYSWNIYPLPDDLNVLKNNPQVTPDQFVSFSKEYVLKNGSSFGSSKKSYEVDRDWEQEVKMSDLGEGEFLLTSKAYVSFPDDWKVKRQASLAAYPFTIKNAKDLASAFALADPNAIEELKKQAEAEKDPIKKKLLLDQIKEMEAREKESDLRKLTKKDAAETQDLIKKAGELKKFILDDRARSIGFSGDKTHDPFMLRLKALDPDLFHLYILIRQIFDYKTGDITAVDEYTKLIQKQYDDLIKLDKRIVRMTGNEKLRKDLPTQRCVAALVKQEDGNLVPLILIIGHHEDSDPKDGNYKMMLLDVTFDSSKKDMTYVGEESSTEKDAINSAFIKFGEDNKYGNGKIIYRVAGTSYRGEVDSVTTATEYLAQALAVIGIVLLIAGAVLSMGTLAPASAAAIGGIVMALGIGTAVAGAALAARNIYKHVDQGTFELDAEFAIDVVSIIGAVVQVFGTVGRLTATLSRSVGAIQRAVTIQRLDKLLLIYDGVELTGNAVLVGLKVQDDIAAVKSLGLSKAEEDEMLQQITMEAIQQGAMLAFASFSKVKDIGEHLTARIEKSKYQSFHERGWVDEHGKPTDQAPPFIRNKSSNTEPGKVAPLAQQGELAWKESTVFEMGKSQTVDKQHNLTVTEKGRIIRCSDFCSDLRMKYNEVLEKDPWINKEMTDLEARAKDAAAKGNKDEAKRVANDAAVFESKLKEADDLRKHLFGMTDKEVDNALEAMDAANVTGGAKSGYRIDDTKIPKRQRRQIDATDLMTDAEIKELGKGGFKKAMDRINKVMGRKISDIDELKAHWESARKDVLKGKQVTDYKKETVIEMYHTARRKFWENVKRDPAAVEFLKKNGFEMEGDGAPLAVLGPQGKEATTRGNVTNQERRISLDHIEEKAQAENWLKALDADNLELMFQNANSWKEIVQVKFGMRDEL
ncbi:hypothetical protein ADIARSV_2338 [Arcticibacter svalbardensis MN12-7]|uniref:DUF4157 domain-containing protein n=1 Tax=Arcticibacter svalbardensis MN12-7 TaxID=1150600 RepID=R9GRL5_9SPHI|nr:DUF4157 domain-containing protein [Arcticibacter svalbardensis]EOR94492.1 hypothetical protein ADIARSV_2338 [Arcticibacter svalbardensis MN12-7]